MLVRTKATARIGRREEPRRRLFRRAGEVKFGIVLGMAGANPLPVTA